MIHEWFTHFGAIAILLAVVSFIAVRAITKRHPAKNSDDRQGNAVGTLFIGAIALVILGVALVLVLFGISGTYVGWVGMVFLGAAFALLSSN